MQGNGNNVIVLINRDIASVPIAGEDPEFQRGFLFELKTLFYRERNLDSDLKARLLTRVSTLPCPCASSYGRPPLTVRF